MARTRGEVGEKNRSRDFTFFLFRVLVLVGFVFIYTRSDVFIFVKYSFFFRDLFPYPNNKTIRVVNDNTGVPDAKIKFDVYHGKRDFFPTDVHP